MGEFLLNVFACVAAVALFLVAVPLVLAAGFAAWDALIKAWKTRK